MVTNMMKKVGPNKNGLTKQGYYTLLHPEKYALEDKRIIYRSSLEFRFCKICDTSTKVIKWASEPFFIQYQHPFKKSKFDKKKPKTCKYYPDFYVELLHKGEVVKYVIEVKPISMLVKPPALSKYASQNQILNYNRKLQTVIINHAKKNAAQKYCNDRQVKYIFITESYFDNFK